MHTLTAELRFGVWRWLLLEESDSPEVKLHRSLGTSGLLASGVLARRAADSYSVVKHLLERYPLWARGHKIVCDSVLEAGDVAGAIAAVDAVVEIEGGESSWSRTRRGEGELRRGEVESSRAIFDALVADGYVTPRILEGLGAALVAEGKWESAAEVLARIPEGARTPPGQMALQFARRKVSEGGEAS